MTYDAIPDILIKEVQVISSHEAKQVPLDEYPGYIVTDNGEIWTVRTTGSHGAYGKPKRKKTRIINGSEGIILQSNTGKSLSTTVSKLVALAFLGEPPFDDAVTIHKNGNVLDNNASNLAWADWEEYGKNKKRNPEMTASGEDGGMSKLTDAQVIEILRRSKNETDISLAQEFNVTRPVITGIRKRQSWRHLQVDSPRQERLVHGGSKHRFAKLNEERVRSIRKEYASGKSVKVLATEYEVSDDAIYDIVNHRSWKHIE